MTLVNKKPGIIQLSEIPADEHFDLLTLLYSLLSFKQKQE